MIFARGVSDLGFVSRRENGGSLTSLGQSHLVLFVSLFHLRFKGNQSIILTVSNFEKQWK